MDKKEMQKELNSIEFILRQYNDKIGDFENIHYTIGYISSIIEKCNNCEPIFIRR